MITKQYFLAQFHQALNNKDTLNMNSSVEQIIQEINSFITKSSGKIDDVDWKDWHIGLTVYPNQEKREQGKPKVWKSWKTDSSIDAVKVQNYFLAKYPFLNLNRKNGKYDYFVYVFKK